VASVTTDPERPLVSVVLPTYNRPERLVDAAESVAAQTYDPIELIVVDDHSDRPAHEVLPPETVGRSAASVSTTTATGERSDDGGVERLRHLRHDRNRGANAARNSGIEAARGEFVALLDDDDRWAPEKIARQVERFREAGESVGVVYTGTRYVGPDGAEQLTERARGYEDTTRAILVGKRIGEFPTAMVRREVFDDAGLPDERFPSWQDREWYLRASRHCRFEPVPEPLLIRGMGHGDQLNENFEAKRDVSYPLFVRKHRSLAAEYGPLVERRFVASLSRALGMAAVSVGRYEEARRYLLRAIRYYPAETVAYPYLLASLGGEYTYRLGQRAVEVLRTARTAVGR
jgi:glycosyltransferase involved in cell wall biosynthesis